MRNWTTIGAEYIDGEFRGRPNRERIEEQIDALDWKDATPTMSLPMSPGLALEACIEQLNLPRVSKIAHNGYLQYPDGPETAHFSLYGIEANYSNGPARVYVLDTGTECIPLASELLEVAAS